MPRIRFALRNLLKSPLVPLVVMLSLGLGIGANTAIFSLLDQVVLRSLPVQNPDEIVLATAPGEFKGGSSRTENAGGMDYIFSHSVFRALEKQPTGLKGLAGFFRYEAHLAQGSQTVRGHMLIVSGQYFALLGVQPLVGRLIAPADDSGAGNPVAVLGYDYWQTRLGGRPEILNQSVSVNGQPFTIVGVAPQGFNGLTLGDTPDVYVPMALKPLLTPGWNGTDRFNDYWIYMFGRLQPGITRPRAETALNGTYKGMLEQQANELHFRNPKQKERFLQSHMSLLDGRQGNSGMRDDVRAPLVILLIATGLVLAIAMANAANLMLARSAERRRELAIRVALGARRGDIIAQLLTEALLLSAGGCLAGLALAYLTLKLLLAQMGGEMPLSFLTARLEWPVLLFGFGLSMLTGLLFGLYPAWEAARHSLAGTLKDEAGQSSSTRGVARVRRVLVCAQVMLSAVLLIPTGLFLKSLLNVLHVDLGLNTENVIGFGLNPRLNRYTDAESKALFERVDRELAALPGVRSVTDCLVPLIDDSNWGTDIVVKGYTGSENNSQLNQIGPGFFGKMGIPLIAGREFTESDSAAAPKVAVVNEVFAKHFFDGKNPIGHTFSLRGSKNAVEIEIVGLVKNSRYSSVRREPPPLFFTPWAQGDKVNYLNFYVRSSLPTGEMVQQIRRKMVQVDRNLPAMDLRTLDDTVRQNIRSDKLILQLAGTFAGLATLLAMLGLYGVMAHSVTRRTREIGIRIALGAAPGKIKAMVLRELAFILTAGLALGVGGAFALVKYIKSQLYGVNAYDAAVIAGAVLVLAGTAVAAGWFPARRAARVNPLDALRYE